jgi:WD40 repeat protein
MVTMPVVTLKCLSFSHDGKYLVAGSEDFSVALYDLERGE